MSEPVGREDWRADRRELRRRAQIQTRRRAAGAAGALVAVAIAVLAFALIGGETKVPPARAAASTKSPVTIQWVGDTVLASAYETPPTGGRDSLKAMTRSLHRADVSWGNLEETLSRGGTSKCGSNSNNCYAFQAPPSYARNLKRDPPWVSWRLC